MRKRRRADSGLAPCWKLLRGRGGWQPTLRTTKGVAPVAVSASPFPESDDDDDNAAVNTVSDISMYEAAKE